MKRKGQKLRAPGMVVMLLLFFALFLNIHFQICYADDRPQEGKENDETEKILEEFEYNEIDDSLKELFPEKRISFKEVTAEVLTGNLQQAWNLLMKFAEEQVMYLLRTGKKDLVHILVIALTAAFMNQFAGIFQNRQAAQVGFYMVYLTLAALTVAVFDVVLRWVESGVENLTMFMGVFYPVYFLAVAVAKGGVTGVAFYNLVLFLIYIVEILIGKVLLPVVRIYMIVKTLDFLSPQDMLGKLSEFIETVIRWALKAVLACVIGANLVQGMISPAIDTVKRSAAIRGAEAIPGVGDLLGGMTEVALGTAVLVKNGIGIAGAVICTALCLVPLIQTAGTALLYKLTAALLQPVCDERITGCVEAVGEGCRMLVQIVFTTGILFLLTIAIVAAVTNV